MNVQIISSQGTPEYAVIPYQDFEHLLEAAEMLDDIQSFDAAMKRISSREEEIFPDVFVERLLADEHPLKVWRDYRNFTLAALASACNVTTSALSQIENRKREPSVALLKQLAHTLGCAMDDLTPTGL
ncbi:MAG: helix-turn-helix transcriptional regulator [Desulfuromonadales bacterium]